MPIFARFEKLQKYYLGEPVMPEEFKPGKLIIIGEYENQEQCETGILYRWFLLTDEYICDNFDKYQKLIYQVSEDNGKTWVNVYPPIYDKGELIEEFSNDCIDSNSIVRFKIIEGKSVVFMVTDKYKGVDYSNRNVLFESSDSNEYISTNIFTYGFNFFWIIYPQDNQAHITEFDFSHYDTSNVTDMTEMFDHCYNLTSLDLSNFNTSNVTLMNAMFNHCSGLTSLDLSNFDTSNVTNMMYMFAGCQGLTSLDLSNFNTSKVTDMASMFSYCTSLTSLDLSNFDISNVKYMSDMFEWCLSLTHIKCKQAFKDWCIENQVEIGLPMAMREGGSGTWQIVG